MPGSSRLTPEQQAVWLDRTGERYVAGQEQPLRPSRRVRRGHGTRQDHELLRLQNQARAQLAGLTVRPS